MEDEESDIQCELMDASIVPSVYVEEDKEVRREDFIQVQNIMHESPKIAIDMSDVTTNKGENIQVEGLAFKIVGIEHINFIGVQNFDIHPNY